MLLITANLKALFIKLPTLNRQLLVQAANSSSSSTAVTNYEVHIRLVPSSYKDLIVKGQPFPFRPNMTASADIQTQTHTNVLSVPLNAVTTRSMSDVKKADSTKAKSFASDNAGDSDLAEVVFAVQPDGKVKLMTCKNFNTGY